MIYTRPIDYFFNYKFGKLPYRSLKFEWENIKTKFYQKATVINYIESKPGYTRITEYKYLTGQQHSATTISKEYSKQKGEPYYPIANSESENQTKLYKDEIKKLNNTQFIGRLAENMYYNMDGVVARILKKYD